MCLTYAIIFSGIGLNKISFISASVIATSILPVVLNYLQKFNLARKLYVFITPASILSYGAIMGMGYGINYFFIVAFSFPFIFLKPNEQKLALAFFLYNSTCLLLQHFVFLDRIEPLQLSSEYAIVIKATVFILVILFVFILFYAYFQTVIKTEAHLIQTNREIQKANQVKQEFLATMSHELRTPLNAVVTISALLEENPEHKDRHVFMKLLKHSSHNLLLIVNDILDFSKLEANKMKLELNSLNIHEVLKKIMETYSNLAVEKGLNLRLEMDPEIAKVYKLDEVKLGQILGNLISNAIKFTSYGDVIVRVEKYKNEGLYDELSFSVTDTGTGISADDLKDIFESFTQIKSVLTRNTGGTGLGLAIVKRLLHLHGSDISVESQLNKGSKFYFSLRLKGTNKIHRPENQKFRITNNKKVLLVEDNAVNAMVAQKLLQTWGLSIETVVNGQLAVDTCHEKIYDIILMDLHMPVMDGFTAAKTIRESGNQNKFVPIYALTADVMGEHHTDYGKYFDGFITKPIQQDKLQNALMHSFAS